MAPLPRRAEALLAILAVADELGATRDRLIGLLWPESDEAHARHSLRDALYSLRQSLGADVVRAVGETLHLNPAIAGSDVQRLHAALAVGCDGDAVAAYGGPFLQGFHLDGTAAFEQWLETERDRLARLYAEALERLAAEAETQGRPREAIGWWARAVAHDPYNTRLVIRHMRALAAAGDRANALAEAEAHRQRLLQKLDVAPGPELAQEVARIRNGVIAPAPRPARAAEAGAAIGVPSGTTPRSFVPGDAVSIAWISRRRLRVAAAGLLVLGALALAGLWAMRFARTGGAGTLLGQGVLDRGGRVLLADFVNRTDDSTITYVVGEGLRALLAGLRYVRLVEPAAVRDGLQRMERGRDVLLDEDLVRELAERENAGAFITGEVSRVGTAYQITARVVGSVDGRVLLTARVTAGVDSDVIPALDRLASAIRRGIGESLRAALARPSLARVTTASLPALRAYSEACRLEDHGWRRTAIALLGRAVALDSTFASAYRKLAEIQSAAGRPWLARPASELAHRYRHRLGHAERLLAEAIYHGQRLDVGAEGLALVQLVEHDPDDVGTLIRYADWMLRQRRFAVAESLAARAVQLDSNSWYGYWYLVAALLAQGQRAAVDTVVMRMPSVDTTAMTVPYDWLRNRMRYILAASDRNGSYLDSRYHSATLYPPERWWIDGLRGRLRRVERLLATDRGPAMSLALMVYRFTGDRDRALRILDTYWRAPRWDTLSPEQRSWRYAFDGAISVLAELGRVRDARALLADWRRTMPDTLDWTCQGDYRRAAIELAEGRPDSAAAAFLASWRAPFCDALYWFNRGLPEAAMAFDRGGRADTAVALYERALRVQSIAWPLAYESSYYPVALRRLGELHDSLGHRREAVDYYTRFAELWSEADPELQPQVRRVRARLARLQAEAGYQVDGARVRS
jgi:DNA-binding SARP family transcriptional activator